MEVKMINNCPVKIWTDHVDESAMRQIENLTTLPFLFHHLAIMPDVHAGMGMPIGGVLACKLGMDHHKEAQDEKYLPTGHDIDKMEIVKRRQVSITKEVGTLGGGNHFIELQKDETGTLWIMIHSGSRNLGKLVGDYYNEKAKMLNEKVKTRLLPVAVIKG